MTYPFSVKKVPALPVQLAPTTIYFVKPVGGVLSLHITNTVPEVTYVATHVNDINQVVKAMLHTPNGATNPSNPVQYITKTGFTLEDLNAVMDVPNGIPRLDANGKIPSSILPDNVGAGSTLITNIPIITGATTLRYGDSGTYIITNYDINNVYTLSAIGGTAIRTNNTIVFTPDITSGLSSFTLNARIVQVIVTSSSVVIPNAPSITLPINNEQDKNKTISYTSGPFSITGVYNVHQKTSWELSTDIDFSNIVYSNYNVPASIKTWTVGDLTPDTTYYARVKYFATNNEWSPWSATTVVKTREVFLPITQEAKLTRAEVITASAEYGHSIAMSGDGNRLVVGEKLPATLGRIYIYVKTGINWILEAKLTSNDNIAGEQFGNSVAIDYNGETIVVGAWTENTATPTATTTNGAAYIFTRTVRSWSQQAKLLASDKSTDDLFGAFVCISGDGTCVAIGATSEDTATPTVTTNNGAVYIYRKNNLLWIEEAKLLASDKASGDFFSNSISIDYNGTYIVIGSYVNGSSDAGAAYIFKYYNNSWIQVTKLLDPTPTSSEQFGLSVYINADATHVVIGSNASQVGAVVFKRDVDTWTLLVNLTYSGKTTSNGNRVHIDNTGTIVSIAGSDNLNIFKNYSANLWSEYSSINIKDSVISLTFTCDPTATSYITSLPTFVTTNIVGNVPTGKLKCYSRTNDQITYLSSIYNGNCGTESTGHSSHTTNVMLSRDGLRCIIGALAQITMGTNTASSIGAAYIYKYVDNTWVTEIILAPTNITTTIQFGGVVSINSNGTRVAISAKNKTIGGISNAGSVYIYSRVNDVWSFEAEVSAPDMLANDYFGASLAFDTNADRLVVGASQKDTVTPTTTTDTGAVYVFKRTNSTWTLETTIRAHDMAASDYFGISVAIDGAGTRIAIGANKDEEVLTDAGSVYVYSRVNDIWTLEAKLLANDPGVIDYFGSVVIMDETGSRIVISSPNKQVGSISNAGAAYVYIRNNTAWSQEVKLLPSTSVASSKFGTSMSIDSTGTRIAISAPLTAPKVYLFICHNQVWRQEFILNPVNTATNTLFGTSVSLSELGNRLAVTIPGDTTLANGLIEAKTGYTQVYSI